MPDSKEEKVLVWMSKEGQPGHTTLGDADCLQTMYGGKIDISIDSDSKFVRVYAHDKETEVCLSEFLTKHAPNLKPIEMSRSEL